MKESYMGKEILGIPEEFLTDTIRVIRAGLEYRDKIGIHIDRKVVDSLSDWCDHMESK